MDQVIDNYIRYVVPKDSEIYFNTPEEGKVSITLDKGPVDISCENNFYARSGNKFEFWKSDVVKLESKDDCTFIVKGCHSVPKATADVDEEPKALFTVFQLDNSYRFDIRIKKDTRLHISTGRDNSAVKIMPTIGKPEILGHKLLLNKEYNLPPESSVLVNSFAYEFGIKIEEKNRQVSILATREDTLERMKQAHNHVEQIRIEAKQNDNNGPIILVIGPQNSGKTSFCRFLLNKAVQGEKWTPVYIDLDVRRNSNSIPGAMSLVKLEFESDETSDLTESFRVSTKKLFYFGSLDPYENINFYVYVVQCMSMVFKSLVREDSHIRYSGAVINICGSLSEDFEVIQQVIAAFGIHTRHTIFILENKDYHKRISEAVEQLSEAILIPASETIEEQMSDELKSFQDNRIFQKYFYNLERYPNNEDYKIIFSDISIYEIAPVEEQELDEEKAFSFREVRKMKDLMNKILGVSQQDSINSVHQVIEIKYFVYVKKVDMTNGTITVISPTSERISNEVLLMGKIEMRPKSPRYDEEEC